MLELYPETCQNLKLRALEKRSIFVYYKNKAIAKSLAAKRGRRNSTAAAGKAEIETPDQDKLLYKSTYTGENDSDEDALHITKPFEHDPDLHHRIL